MVAALRCLLVPTFFVVGRHQVTQTLATRPSCVSFGSRDVLSDVSSSSLAIRSPAVVARPPHASDAAQGNPLFGIAPCVPSTPRGGTRCICTHTHKTPLYSVSPACKGARSQAGHDRRTRAGTPSSAHAGDDATAAALFGAAWRSAPRVIRHGESDSHWFPCRHEGAAAVVRGKWKV